nr:hypothetical protein BaRGS_020544 [Batillaria attramentaria]
MVSGILADRLGIRTVSLIGGLLALVGMLCSAFVQNILLLYLTYGVIMGTGFSLAYTPSVAILGHYFKRRIGMANGLVAFGGALIFILGYSLALPVLFDAIGFKYTLLCISDLRRVRQVRLQQAAFLVMGMTTSCTPLAGTFASLLVIAVVFGMCDGTLFCMFGPVAFDLVGPADSTQALGFVFGLLALPGALGPPLAEYECGLRQSH